MCQHPTRKLTLGFFTGNTYLQGFKRHCFCELDTKCKRHLVNSKWLDGKKLNLNTLIREAPRSSNEQKIHGSHFLKEVTSVCILFVVFFQLMVAFGYKPLSSHLLPASQLFKVPVGLCHDLAFQFTTRPCALTQTTSSSTQLLWLLLSFRKRLVQQKGVIQWCHHRAPENATKGLLWACLSLGWWKPRKSLCSTGIKSLKWSPAQVYFH